VKDPQATRELNLLAHALDAHLERAAQRGTRRVPMPVPTAAPPAAAAAPTRRPPAPKPVAAPQGDPRTASPTAPLAAAAPDLASLQSTVAACEACGLCRTRTQTVFSDGTGSARVLFIGEAPGQDEDEQGVPFVGRSGALLTDIIEKGMKLRREEVYIANVLKCRPPGNRDPETAEKELCTPFLDRQIELLDPQLLITLGLHASRHILKSTSSLARMRGRVHQLGGRKVIATYHPAFLLRSPHMKKDCWQDIQMAMAELGLPRS